MLSNSNSNSNSDAFKVENFSGSSQDQQIIQCRRNGSCSFSAVMILRLVIKYNDTHNIPVIFFLFYDLQR
jgi:hypothetical protein